MDKQTFISTIYFSLKIFGDLSCKDIVYFINSSAIWSDNILWTRLLYTCLQTVKELFYQYIFPKNTSNIKSTLLYKWITHYFNKRKRKKIWTNKREWLPIEFLKFFWESAVQNMNGIWMMNICVNHYKQNSLLPWEMQQYRIIITHTQINIAKIKKKCNNNFQSLSLM